MKNQNSKLIRTFGVTAIAVVLLGVSVLAVAKRPSQGHGLAKFPGFPVAQVVGPPNPQAVAPGSGSFTLRVFGANFTSSSVVNWNRQPRVTTFVSGHEVDAQILASDVATATAGTITVTNSTPGGPVTSSTWTLVEVHDPTATFVLGTEGTYVLSVGSPLLAGDINGDGNLDLALASFSGSATIKPFLGSPSGQLTAVSAATFNYYSGGTAAFADFNGDGNLDLVFTKGDSHVGPPLALQVNLGNGNGTFTPGPRVATFAQVPVGLVVGDFNQDGALDLVVNVAGTPLYLGNGDGTFSKGGGIFVPSLALLAGDFNGDGKLDLVSEAKRPGGNSFEIRILLGNGDGTFQKAQDVVTVASPGFQPLLVTDLNGDGNLDIVYSDNGQLGVLLGRGDGTFLPPVFHFPGTFSSFVAGDFNSDGKTDLIASAATSRELVLLLGNGDGTFRPTQMIKVPHGADHFVIGDFNSDGLQEPAGIGNSLDVFLQK